MGFAKRGGDITNTSFQFVFERKEAHGATV